MSHRIVRLLFAFGVGFLVAFLAFRWISDPAPRAERQLEESAVVAARQQLEATLELDGLQIVDPLAPDRKVGKAYVYRADDGWEVSGYYRRDGDDAWHPYLMRLDGARTLSHLKVGDGAFVDRADTDPRLEALP